MLIIRSVQTFLILFISLIAVEGASAQINMHENERVYKLNFGFTVGINSSNFRIKRSENFVQDDNLLVVETDQGPGFNVGIISDLTIDEHWSLRFIPALSFADRGIDYIFCDSMDNNMNCLTTTLSTQPIESIFTTFPLLLKFSSDRLKNNKVYLIGGFRYTYDWASNSEARLDEEVVKITKSDFSLEYGAGLDIFLPMAKIAFEIKASYGLKNILVPSDAFIFSNALDRLNSRSILFSIHIGG